MKHIGLQAGIIGVGLSLAGILAISYMEDATPRYQERKFDNEHGIAGAIEHYYQIKKNPLTNTLSYDDIYASRAQVDNHPVFKSAALNLNWLELGPDNIGGRTRAVLIDKNNPDRIFAGGVAGGLWISNDGASSWTPYGGALENIAVTCITQAANGDIYFGTGEGLYPQAAGTGAGGIAGGGVWKSTDGGNTFTRLTETIPAQNRFGSVLWACVNQITAHPTNANRIYAATSYGLMMTEDGGSHWFHPVRLGTGQPFTTIAYDVDVAGDGTTVVASSGGVEFRSTSGDSGSFTLQHTFSGGSRTEFAIAPSDDNYIYAGVANSFGYVQGIYQSTDKGQTWTLIGPGGSWSFTPYGVAQGQGNYDNALAVSPVDKGKLILGGVELWSWQQYSPSTPGVGSWSKIAFTQDAFTPNGLYVHADVHTATYDATRPNIIYLGTDGGVFKSIDGGNSWGAANKGYNVTQFYHLAFETNGANGTGVMGGTQDNSHPYIPGTLNTVQWADELNSGDGGYSEISFLNPRAFFMESQYGNLVRSSNYGATPSSFYSSRLISGAQYATNRYGAFVTPFALYENNDATNSKDSLWFVNNRESKLEFTGDGITKVITGTLVPSQTSASIVPDSVRVVAGSQVLIDDAAGNLTGDGTGTINHATGVYSLTLDAAPASFTSVNFEYDLTYNPGSKVNVVSNTADYTFDHTFTSTVNPRDSVRIQDRVVSRFAIGFIGNGGVWMTKEALNFSKTPEWFKLGNINGSASCMEWTADGDILYVGTNSGEVYRFSNLSSAVDSITGDVSSSGFAVVQTKIADFGTSYVTGLAVDPNNADRVIATLGGYTGTAGVQHIWYSTTASTCGTSSTTTNFTSVQGSGANKLPEMPVYDAIFEMNNSNTVILATEYGIYATDDITQAPASLTWTEENGGSNMMRVPTFAIRQQTLPWWSCNNSGTIYIGTHGRGIWKEESYAVTTSVDEGGIKSKSGDFASQLRVYPNPMQKAGNIAFELSTPVTLNVGVFDLQGRLVKSFNTGRLNAGKQNIALDVSTMPAGTYLVNIEGDGVNATTRLVVAK